jgi:hypothetical protein
MLGIENEPHRFDVVTVVIAGDSTPQIELLRNFWTEESLVHKMHKEEHKKHKAYW